MFLSKAAIIKAIEIQKLKIEPFSPEDVGPAHIDLHLDLADKEKLIIKAKGFVLAKTKEKITFDDDICGFIEGRAGLAKQGISIEQSSTFIEPGSEGYLTLEIFNASESSVVLEQNQQIAKMFIAKLTDSL